METKDLNQKIELWGITEVIDELKNPIREKQLLKSVWVKILPKHGKQESIGDNAERVRMNVVIRCRKLSIKNPSIEMFFRRNNITYEIIDFIEDMKDNQFWEFSCKIIYE